MEKITLLRCALGASALLAFGCRAQEVESTDVRTSGVYPEIDITATGSGSSRVEVRLKVGGPSSNTFLDLQGSDALKATFGGLTKTLDANSHTYAATFPTDAQGELVIAFLRGPDDVSAPSSTVTVPAPFTLALSTTEASRASADVGVTWDPPGSGNMGLHVDGSCIQSFSEPTPDDGTATVTRDRIRTSGNQSTNCTVNVGLERTQSGQVDPAFTEGGRVTARQTRTASFTSTP